MDAPSAELTHLLNELRLATPRDVERCRRWVKQRSKGLPTFDSIWIDALIRFKKITPFQGQLLERQNGEALKVSRHLVLTDRQQADHQLAVYAAKHLETGERFLVTRVQMSLEDREQGLARLETAISHQSRSSLKNSFYIDAVFPVETGIDVITPFQAGEALDRLVIRRGRFPEAVVRGLAIELSQQLAFANSTPHGDLRLANVRLQKNGQVGIVNWGIVCSLFPEVSIHTTLPVDYLQAISPERFNSGLSASKTSDMYALGCLLWQLLAGRTPFPMADPLSRIVAHQQQTVPDIRTIAPDTSEVLASLIKHMTLREPHRRLQSFRSIIDELQQSRSVPRKRLKQFIRTFETAAPRRPMNSPSTWKRKLITTSVAGLLTLAFTGLMWNRTSLGLPTLSSVSATTLERPADSSPANSAQDKSSVRQLLPLPPVNAQGVVLLTESQHYAVGNLQFNGTLILRSAPGQLATILIDDQALQLSAEIVRIENVQILDEREQAISSAIQLKAQELVLRSSRFQRSEFETASSFIDWIGNDNSDPRSGRVLISDSEFVGAGTLLHAYLPLSTAGFENVLKQGSGPVLRLESGVRAGLKVPLVLNRCTLRDCGSLVVYSGKEITQTGRLSLQGGDTVFAPLAGYALFELRGMNIHSQWEQHLEIYSQGLIVPDTLPLVIQMDDASESGATADAGQLAVDGLLAGKFAFSKDGRVQIQELPIRTSSLSVGADYSRFPQVKSLR